MKLNELIKEEKPREKLKRLGVKYLSDSELLSIILRTGNKNESVNELSTRVLKEIGGVKYLKDMSVNSLCKINGIKLSKASIILASFELARRSLEVKDTIKLNSPKLIYEYIKSDYINTDQEKFTLLFLDNKLDLINKKELYIGTNKELPISPREIFKEALKENSSKIVLIHNHPSGDITPSNKDNEVTRNISLSGKLMEIEVVDHLIIGNNNYFSYKNNSKYTKYIA